LTRWTRTLAAAAVLSAAAAASAPSAWAHARVVSTTPGDGAVLATAPRQVTIRFDEPVRALGGTVVVANKGKRPVAAQKPRTRGSKVVIPLSRLREGDYTVRWRVLSDDGHTLEGVFAFAVGAGRAAPTAALAAGGTNLTREVISRWFFFAGLLVAVGVALFVPLAWRPALRAAGADPDERALWPLAFAGFLLAFLGAATLIPHHDPGSTRFGLTYEIGGIIAVIGATLSAIALVDRRLGRGAFLCALALLPIPSIAGHALDRGQWPRPLNVAADILHVGAASVWIGGLLALAIGLPRARRLTPEQRARFGPALVGRLSAIALLSVAVIGATGLIRAFSELSAFSQLWSSGYGRAIAIKSGLLLAVVALGWVNRSRLIPALRFDALRRNVAAELVLIAGIVIAVAFLTDLAPGRQLAGAIARPATPRPIAAPPPDAVVLAGESGDRAVGLAILPRGRLQATVLGPDEDGVDGLSVGFRAGGKTVGSTPCGPGCYRAVGRLQARRVTVLLDSGPVSFRLPTRTEHAGSLVARARRAYASLKSLVIHERLASSPRDRITTTWHIVAPDRLTYVTSEGSRAIVVGGERWDADANGKLVRSAQTPLQLPGSQWGPRWLNARALGWTRVGGIRARLVSFFDPQLPGWFELAMDPRTSRPLELQMTAAAHFMHHRYTDFNRPTRIEPPR
jgi:methionine-rich copper-binding protein CopC/putative copper export protein